MANELGTLIGGVIVLDLIHHMDRSRRRRRKKGHHPSDWAWRL